jgi:hypothetical protein
MTTLLFPNFQRSFGLSPGSTPESLCHPCFPLIILSLNLRLTLDFSGVQRYGPFYFYPNFSRLFPELSEVKINSFGEELTTFLKRVAKIRDATFTTKFSDDFCSHLLHSVFRSSENFSAFLSAGGAKIGPYLFSPNLFY